MHRNVDDRHNQHKLPTTTTAMNLYIDINGPLVPDIYFDTRALVAE